MTGKPVLGVDDNEDLRSARVDPRGVALNVVDGARVLEGVGASVLPALIHTTPSGGFPTCQVV